MTAERPAISTSSRDTPAIGAGLLVPSQSGRRIDKGTYRARPGRPANPVEAFAQASITSELFGSRGVASKLRDFPATLS